MSSVNNDYLGNYLQYSDKGFTFAKQIRLTISSKYICIHNYSGSEQVKEEYNIYGNYILIIVSHKYGNYTPSSSLRQYL